MSDLISSKEILTFGKYKSQNIKDIIRDQPAYCKWLLNRSGYLNEDQIKLIKSSINDEDVYLSFGKYKNKTLKWIFENDKPYIMYLQNNDYVRNKMPSLIDEILKL